MLKASQRAFVDGNVDNEEKLASFKVPITPKHFFHLVQSLYGIRKNAAKIFAFG